jgi:hypothetical protein
MNAFNRGFTALVLGIAAGLAVTSPDLSASSTQQAFDSCRAEAEVAYGSLEEPAVVRLDGVRKSGKQLRLKVFTPEGEQLIALCNVDRKTGDVVSLDPAGKSATDTVPGSD